MTLELIRYAVLGLFVLSTAAALGSWAVTTRRISPFGRTAQLIRKTTDPIFEPMERWLVRRGKNPQHAPWWLVGITVVAGILVITLSDWAVGTFVRGGAALRAGPRAVIRLLVYYAGQLVILALIVRVIASWFGKGRYNPWIRPAYLLTDWIVEPLRRIVPPIGMFDITPIIAWVVMQVLLSIVLRII